LPVLRGSARLRTAEDEHPHALRSAGLHGQSLQPARVHELTYALSADARIAIPRIERSVMAVFDRSVEPSGGSGVAADSALDHVLTWTVVHEQRFSSEGEANEVARSLPGKVILKDPIGHRRCSRKAKRKSLSSSLPLSIA
jgi:hypothetical protein